MSPRQDGVVMGGGITDEGEQALRAELAERADEPDAQVELSPQEAVANGNIIYATADALTA